jgi:2C-methyl-D-erythritol 2,4-cyclodiphosphate synthase
MENVSAEYFNTMPDAAGNAKEQVLKRTSETMAGVASSLKNGRDAVKNAADFLKQALKDAMSPAKEKKDLNKFLDSKELKNALNSQDAVVKAAAQSAKQAAEERLYALNNGVPEAAIANQISYDDAYKAATDASIAAMEADAKAQQDAAALQLSNNMFRWGERTMLAYGEGMTSGSAALKAHLHGVMADLVPIVEAKSPPGMDSPLHNISDWGTRTVTAFGDGMKKASVALRQSAAMAVGTTRPEFDGAAAMGVSNAAASSASSLVINNNFQPGSVRKDDDIRHITERIHVQARLRGGLHGGGAAATSL